MAEAEFRPHSDRKCTRLLLSLHLYITTSTVVQPTSNPGSRTRTNGTQLSVIPLLLSLSMMMCLRHMLLYVVLLPVPVS